MVGEKYLQALIDGADGLPLIIPSLAAGIDIDELLGRIDGILLTGSLSNVEPHQYAGEDSAAGTLHDSERDALTLPLACRAIEQGVRKLAPGVSVEALADDGLVEGFRVDDVPGFALAVQWHPEWKATENEFSMKIFKAFGDACRERAAARQA